MSFLVDSSEVETGNPYSPFVPCEGALDPESECRGHGPLPVCERDERHFTWIPDKVEGRRKMPQIGIPYIANLERSFKLLGQWPIRQDPLDAGDETWFKSVPLTCERGTQFRRSD